jgi:hypothetical protein
MQHVADPELWSGLSNWDLTGCLPESYLRKSDVWPSRTCRSLPLEFALPGISGEMRNADDRFRVWCLAHFLQFSDSDEESQDWILGD